MKHYLKPDGSLWAFPADGTQDDLITPDMREATDAEVLAIQNPPKSQTQIREELEAAVQKYLDDTAKARGYDGILSLCSYKDSSKAQFAAEAASGIVFRDTVWTHCYQVLADVQVGNRSIPTAVQLLSELPTIQWPT